MKMLIVTLLLAMPTSVSAQSLTYPDVYRLITRDAFFELQKALPNRTFRVSSSTKKGVDGMVKTVSVRIKFDKASTPAEIDAKLRAEYVKTIKELAARISPYKAFGMLSTTRQSNTDFVKQTPDSLVDFSNTGIVLRTRYTDGTVFFEALVGN
ncbi:MAG: hypothetical protein E6R03_01905 [Hyphomicrobiaceae bacterium]|nr:MAG: hypothetical protein E6R03_01905 [Hyphomicrobiaceae bacterium]